MKEFKLTARNVTRLVRGATDEEFMAGVNWYSDARIIAQALADRGGVTVDCAAGVIAALSPLRSWGENVNLAARAIDSGGLVSGTMRDQILKVNTILGGAEPLDTLGGLKVRAFYECIIAGGDTSAVCIDRHAIDILLNTRNTDDTRLALTPKRYAAAVKAYRSAAKILSKELGVALTGAQVQAIAWVAWRNKFYAAGAYDNHSVEV